MESDETPLEALLVASEGGKSPSVKKHKRSTWTPSEIGYLHLHPDMTALEIGRKLGRSEASVEHARQRYGRWDSSAQKVCACCSERVVWEESEHARRLRLCKGCYLREMRVRQSEDAEANRVRQARFRARRRGDGR